MRSAREKAMSTSGGKAKPRKVSMPADAQKVLVKLERARAYGSKRKYNKELNSLIAEHPEMKAEIEKLMWI